MMFNRLPSGEAYSFFIMTEEQIKAMTEEYTKNYISRFKKVAEQAYIDGMLAAMKYMKEKLSEI